MYQPPPIGLDKDGKLNRNVCTFSVKQPKDCTEREINDFYELIFREKRISSNSLLERIENCELLAFCYILCSLVAVSAIKKPSKSYISTIISKTTIDRKWSELPLELGFSATEEAYRKNGLSKTLKSLLLEEMKSQEGIIFSVTANKTSQNFLLNYGFNQKGIPYDGINGIDIKYYEINIKDLK